MEMITVTIFANFWQAFGTRKWAIENMARTTRLELATSAVTEHHFFVTA
jgi:hypothetical protein